jgi:transcriptional regulator with XRE-family HTH domain
MVSADLLREARVRAGLTQAELGWRAGKPASAISRWERGAVQPSLETLRELIRACGLELCFRFANYDDSYVHDIEDSLDLTPAERVGRAVERANTIQRLRPAIEAARRG